MSDVQMSARSLEALLGDWRGGASAYLALSDRIRLLTLDGRIPVDSRLPAERDLSARLGLSRTTVAAAYRRLRETGFLVSVRGSGSMARLPGGTPSLTVNDGSGILDFSKATMPAIPALAAAAVAAAADLPRHLNDSGFDPIGLPELRAAIADRYTVRGLPTGPEQIMVTIGAQHAIALLARVLLSRGDRAVIETPTYPHAYEALRAAGARLMPVSVSAGEADAAAATHGWDEAALVQTLQRSNPVLGYLMPDFHNPTGQSMPVDQRERVLAAAARQGTVLIADETMAEFNIDRPGEFMPFAAYADPALPGTAVSIGSVGKSVWGGIRVGWIRAEPALIRKLVAARTANDLGTPILEQLIVTRLLPQMPAILAERCDALRLTRDHLEERLAARFPDWTVPHVDGGVTTWVNLGSPVSSQLALSARTHGVIVPAGPRFGIDGAFERFMRIPFCYSVSELDRAVDALGHAWDALGRHPVPDTGYLADVV
ncbi:MocR-like transcription factor YczR [Glaciibacter psychrotolerans]|uniref:DNA-binding transcriptional MocR family regulator n=1 Tax=Glaciibacter psychrotolerans TaxID=670054 RepID=A0A7Z0EI97_9MICO|nr:PLP-dependent aminotransferase family protein [Leifsonia psychrotolerans]NYJ21359.1 DNA-binding transcriptional MocR family regulator [Leifsonia psychrotolerans]